ncbi:hypothetical protein CTAYLR_009103 [Chrysophaeum taylorii]|uniref:Right handed beta helix domain-containing protein n=1 Tax=Chrysophaeum taylorii TaxID=2483200 RepID=A0AAD7XRR1_9STRA|nr:hypothetical protein CTAYLR_009103 [Chrysophaeum taylorii]
MEVEDVVSLASDIPMRSALTVSKHLSISSETGAALDGQQAVQVIVVEDDGDLSLDNVAIKYGRSETMGGAVAVLGGTLELFRCGVFNSAVRQGGGGAIYVAQGTLHVIDSTFYDNSASTGGVISLDNSAMTMSGCTLRNNSAIIGGAIVARASTLDVVGSAFVKNTAEALGGAISIGLRSRLVATSCHFADNEARSSARNETCRDRLKH